MLFGIGEKEVGLGDDEEDIVERTVLKCFTVSEVHFNILYSDKRALYDHGTKVYECDFVFEI